MQYVCTQSINPIWQSLSMYFISYVNTLFSKCLDCMSKTLNSQLRPTTVLKRQQAKICTKYRKHGSYSFLSTIDCTLQIYTVKLQWKWETCKKCTLYKYLPYTVQCRSYSKKTVNQLYIYSTVLSFFNVHCWIK